MQLNLRKIAFKFPFAAFKREAKFWPRGQNGAVETVEGGDEHGNFGHVLLAIRRGKELPAWFQDASKFADGARAIRYVIKHVVCDQSVEAGIGKWQVLGVDNVEGATGAGDVCARLRDHTGRQIRVDHPPAHGNACRILLPKPARPAANLGNTGLTR